MADNYLERKMEDYRRGASAPRRLTHTGDAPGVLRLKVPPRPVLILDAAGNGDETLISMLTGAGFKVAFTAADAVWGRALAQRVGALYLPEARGAVELLQQRWRCPAVTVIGVEASSLHSADVRAMKSEPGRPSGHCDSVHTPAEPSGHCGSRDASTPLGYALRKIAEIIEQPI